MINHRPMIKTEKEPEKENNLAEVVATSNS